MYILQLIDLLMIDIYNSTIVQPRDLWILSRLNTTIEETNCAIQNYLFGNATSSLHSFFLYDLCDVYLGK